MGKYRATVGITYPSGTHVEPGEIRDDIPAQDLRWLLDGGYIEPVDDEPKPRRRTPKSEGSA